MGVLLSGMKGSMGRKLVPDGCPKQLNGKGCGQPIIPSTKEVLFLSAPQIWRQHEISFK